MIYGKLLIDYLMEGMKSKTERRLIFLKINRSQLKVKFNETLKAVFPILAIVLDRKSVV